jgi:serine/threonine protein kinase
VTIAAPRRHFEIMREIAAGGFGSVYVAKLVQPDGFSRIVAVKLLHPKWSENEEVASRMRDEARLLGLLRHRNIVDVLDLTRIDGRVAIVMEYLEAVDGRAILDMVRESGEPLPMTVALQICAQVSSALDAAYGKAPYEGHQPLHVIHRDIKPSNVMVDGTGVVKVLDFGVARADFDEREARTQGMAFGSFDYMPPERRFMDPGGPTSDVYSVAAVLFELLVGEKIGKGKLKPVAHAEWVEERVLVASEHMSAAVRDDLAPLLARMLAFGETDRPKAGRVTTAFRKLARNAGDESLEEWAERKVPPLLDMYRKIKAKEAASPMVGKTMIEDHGSLSANTTDGSNFDDDTDPNESGSAPGSQTQWVGADDATAPSPARRIAQPVGRQVAELRPQTANPASVRGAAVGSMRVNTPAPVMRQSGGVPNGAGQSSMPGPGGGQAGAGVSSLPGPAVSQVVNHSTVYVTKEVRITKGPSPVSTALYFLVSAVSWGILGLGLLSILGAAVLVATK